MGIEWLNAIVKLLRDAGIRADEGFPGQMRMEIASPVAAVGLRGLDWREGLAEFEIRILSPRNLGGWQCQTAAAEAVAALENGGVLCRMEPMDHQAGTDCFEMLILGEQYVLDSGEESTATGIFEILIGEEPASHVTEFSAEQNRERRLIGSVNDTDPIGITPAKGGWQIRLVQTIPAGGVLLPEAAEPFDLTVKENGLTTRFSGCGWNRVKKELDQSRIRMEWEGFALTREEMTDG